MNKRIVNITENILKSYNETGGLNCCSGQSLPSRQGVISALTMLESIIFPGFQEEELLQKDFLPFTVGGKVNCLTKNLIREIRKSLASENDGNNAEELRRKAEELTLDILEQIPRLRGLLMKDVQAALRGDPAARSMEEIILSYPGLEAVLTYRIAHEFFIRDIPLIPRLMTEFVHKKTGIDIHPGAAIGEYFFIDHGTGVVFGETAIVGDNVKIYQGVTLGALSVKKEEANIKRHPTIEDDVTIYAGATILGGGTVIGKGTVIGGNVWITSSIPPGSVVYNKPADYVMKNRYRKDS
jgi:serine O-acetyltransferase